MDSIDDRCKVLLSYEIGVPGGSAAVTVLETSDGKGVLDIQYHGNVPDEVKERINKMVSSQPGFEYGMKYKKEGS